jgi:hypothetical protein
MQETCGTIQNKGRLAMELWKKEWFIKFITWCRKWKWFDTYIYGKSVNLEDFVRNPAEVFRDSYAPFIIKDVKAYSIINLRIGYIPYSKVTSPKTSFSVPMGDNKIKFGSDDRVHFDLRFFNPWFTKFCNARLFFQFALSFKWYVIPIPYVSLCIRLDDYKYFQFGLGWGAESHRDLKVVDAVLCGKLRYVNQKTSTENNWNNQDTIGFYEGTI